jgi:hypothetical protein
LADKELEIEDIKTKINSGKKYPRRAWLAVVDNKKHGDEKKSFHNQKDVEKDQLPRRFGTNDRNWTKVQSIQEGSGYSFRARQIGKVFSQVFIWNSAKA